MRENTFGENIVGKYYNYAEQIPDLEDLGISSHGSFDQLETNMKGLLKYGNIILEGPPLGRNYFIRAGVCGDGEKKWDYIRNLPDGDTIFGSSYKGLAPGMLQDVGDIHPFDIFRAISGKNVNSLEKKSLSDWDKRPSGCKEICRREQVCTYKPMKDKKDGKMKTCRYINSTRKVSNIYDERRDLNSKVCQETYKDSDKKINNTEKKMRACQRRNIGVFCNADDKMRAYDMKQALMDKNYEPFVNYQRDMSGSLIKRIIYVILLLFVFFSLYRHFLK